MELWHVNNSDPKEADAVPDGGYRRKRGALDGVSWV